MIRFLFILFISSFRVFSQETDTASVYFDFDQTTFDPQAPPGVSLMAQMGKEGVFEIVGLKAYCDTNGSVPYNLDLAKRRLNAVEKVLGTSNRNFPREVIGEGYSLNKGYRSADYRRVDIIYVARDRAVEPEPEAEAIPEKVPLVESFEKFLRDSTSTEITLILDVHFFPGSRSMLPESQPEMGVLFDFLHYNQDVTAFIRGHVCCSDDMPLSIERAEVVYNYLIDRSISPKRLSYKGFSNTMPAVTPEVTEADRRMNRRVDVVFTKTK